MLKKTKISISMKKAWKRRNMSAAMKASWARRKGGTPPAPSKDWPADRIELNHLLREGVPPAAVKATLRPGVPASVFSEELIRWRQADSPTDLTSQAIEAAAHKADATNIVEVVLSMAEIKAILGNACGQEVSTVDLLNGIRILTDARR